MLQCENGMITGLYYVPMHFDQGDGELGYTCCQSLAARENNQVSRYFFTGVFDTGGS